MKKNLALAMAMGVASNLYAMNEEGSSGSIKMSVPEMKKCLELIGAMFLVDNPGAMNDEEGSSSSSKLIIPEPARLDENAAKSGMSKGAFLDELKSRNFRTHALTYLTLKTKRDILAIVFEKKLNPGRSINWIKPLTDERDLELMLRTVITIAYEEKDEAIIKKEKLLEALQCLKYVEVDNALFKAQITTMKQALGMTKKVRKKAVQKKKA